MISRKSNRTIILSVLASACFAAATAEAATIVTYDFNNQATVNSGGLMETSNASFVAANVTASLYNAYGTNTGRSGISSTNEAFFNAESALGNFSAAVDSTITRHEFTITANGSNTLNLSNITFNYYNTGTIGDGHLVIQSSINGFGSGNLVIGNATVTANTTSDPSNFHTFSLAGLQFQGVTSVTFRLTAYDDTTSNTPVHRIDNLTVNGAVVPEPSAAGLLAMTGLAVLGRRRR